MEPDEIRHEVSQLVARDGPWTAHNLRLADGVFTIGPEPAGDEVKLRRVTQTVADLCGGDLHGVRVLDLACLEGMYALELAKRGAAVMAVDGREVNLAKVRLAARALGVAIDVQLGDVRDLSRDRHGTFDVVLCLGLLYHLDAADLFPFVQRLAEVCDKALIVDTHTPDSQTEERRYDGHPYTGRVLVEHAPDATEEDRLRAVWSSLDNPFAFALTKPSLVRLLARSGFTSVHETHLPAEPEKVIGRTTLVALKGSPIGRLLTPDPATRADDVRERPPLSTRLVATRAWSSIGRRALPRALRARIRGALGVETRRH
jgi:SAM-dependent methyltransferase